MRDWESIIQKNLEKARGAEKIEKSIKIAQIDEVVRILKKEKRRITPKEIKESFEKSFCITAVSSEYLRLVAALCEKSHSEKHSCVTCPKVIYVESPLWQKAIRTLTSHLKSPEFMTGSDFRSLCESVSSSDCDYCALPLCSSKDGYYTGFLKLIKSYELKICRTVQITKPDSDEELSFALLSKNIESADNAERAVFSFTESDGVSLTALLSALCGCNCRPVSVISAPLEYNIEMFEHRVEIILGDLTPLALLFFLDSAVPGHTVHGIY